MASATGVTPTQATAFHRGTLQGKELTPQQREELLKPFLPSEPTSSSDRDTKKTVPSRRRKSVHKKRTGTIRTSIHFFIYHVVALLFSVFFRFRRAYRLVRGKIVSLLKYHHRTPEFIAHDVKSLQKLPKHLSVVIDYQEDDEHQGNAGLEGLVNDVCEIAAWTASAGIPFLSVYERTGRQHLSNMSILGVCVLTTA
jgi:dehydrodolichyl diphosphate syntase complex subunit NUS1